MKGNGNVSTVQLTIFQHYLQSRILHQDLEPHSGHRSSHHLKNSLPFDTPAVRATQGERPLKQIGVHSVRVECLAQQGVSKHERSGNCRI